MNLIICTKYIIEHEPKSFPIINHPSYYDNISKYIMQVDQWNDIKLFESE